MAPVTVLHSCRVDIESHDLIAIVDAKRESLRRPRHIDLSERAVLEQVAGERQDENEAARRSGP